MIRRLINKLDAATQLAIYPILSYPIIIIWIFFYVLR